MKSQRQQRRGVWARLEALWVNLDSKFAYGPPAQLYRAARRAGLQVSLRDCKSFLSSVPAYNLNRYARTKYRRNPVIAPFAGFVVAGDIAVMQGSARRDNRGYAYILFLIDVFSKWIWAEPLVSRQTAPMLAAFKKALSQLPFKVVNLWFDKEGSVWSREGQKFFKDRDVNPYRTLSETKASNVERLIRSWRLKLSRYQTQRGTEDWVSFLPIFVRSYNYTPHPPAKKSPYLLVTNPLSRVHSGRDYASLRYRSKLPPIGSFVRLNTIKAKFAKETSALGPTSWTREIFKISSHVLSSPIPMVRLVDLLGKQVFGSFYREEIQPVIWSGQKTVFQVHARREDGPQGPEIQVSYSEYPRDFREWVSEGRFRELISP